MKYVFHDRGNYYGLKKTESCTVFVRDKNVFAYLCWCSSCYGQGEINIYAYPDGKKMRGLSRRLKCYEERS